MKWYEIVTTLRLIRRELAYAEFKTFRTKGELLIKWEGEVERLKVREGELVQMKIDYDMGGKFK